MWTESNGSSSSSRPQSSSLSVQYRSARSVWRTWTGTVRNVSVKHIRLQSLGFNLLHKPVPSPPSSLPPTLLPSSSSPVCFLQSSAGQSAALSTVPAALRSAVLRSKQRQLSRWKLWPRAQSYDKPVPAVGPAAVTGKRKREKTRKYTDNYLKFGFTFKETDDIEFPMCVICFTVLSNESMKPSKLQRHLETTHSHLKDKPVGYFQTCLKSLQGQQTLMRKSATVGELALKCSYQVALRIAQKKEPYTLGEDLILPSATDMCKTMYGNDIDINKLKTVPLSDTTIARRIDEMASDVRVQLTEKLRLADVLQLDDSTDVPKDAQLLAFVRFVDQNEMQEEFLFCKRLPERTTKNDISWAKCVALCTDGARAMAGLKSGLIALVRDVAPEVIWTHCMLHRESLVAKDMSAELSDVMGSAVKVVNIVKKSALQT
uniref:SCAN domain-containing protein 3 n=1 Tax=Dicentrarchus labrax TaxID=13489 RepID=A0A8P4GCM0_DICLA